MFTVMPLYHNFVLKGFSSEIMSIPTPEGTDMLDSLKLIRHQTGNSNHCDYLAAIRIDSNLSKEELTYHYKTGYKGDSNLEFIWLDEQNEYTVSTTSYSGMPPIYTLGNWLKERSEAYVHEKSSTTKGVAYIFEAGMTDALDWRCR